MAACFDLPLPRILLAKQQSRSHASRDPACQPATSLPAWNNMPTLGRSGAGSEERFSRLQSILNKRVSDIRTDTEGGRGEKGKTQWPRSAFKDSGALEPEQQQQREANPNPSLDGYRQKTRTFLSVQLKKMWCSSGEPNKWGGQANQSGLEFVFNCIAWLSFSTTKKTYSLRICWVTATVIDVIHVLASTSKYDFYCPRAPNHYNTSTWTLTQRRGSADGSVMALPGVWISGRLTSLAELLFKLGTKILCWPHKLATLRKIEPNWPSVWLR